MKRFLLLTLIFTLLSTTVYASAQNTIIVSIDGNDLSISQEDGKVFIDTNSRTQVPVRVIAEALGYMVTWDPAKYEVGLKKEDAFVKIAIGSNTAETNNGTIVMDTSAFINKSEARTYVPLRFISEALGYEVSYRYISGRHVVEITSPIISTDELIVVDGIEQVLTDDAYEMNGGTMSDYQFGLNKDASAGYWDGKSDVQEDIALFNDKVIPSYSGDDFNENGYSRNLPLSFGRDDDGNPVIRTRGWRTSTQEKNYPSVVANVNLTMELLRYYTGSEADTVLIANFIDDKAINRIDFGEGVFNFGDTKIKFTDPGVFGMDIHVLK